MRYKQVAIERSRSEEAREKRGEDEENCGRPSIWRFWFCLVGFGHAERGSIFVTSNAVPTYWYSNDRSATSFWAHKIVLLTTPDLTARLYL